MVYLRNMGTTVLLLTSVMLGHRFSTSHALPNTVSASALHTQYDTRVGQGKGEENVRNKERGRERSRVREKDNFYEKMIMKS